MIKHKKLSLDEIQKHTNCAEYLEESQLNTIAEAVCRGYEIDLDSLSELKEKIKFATDMANQVMEVKNTPWPNASNIKYPLITQAVIDFAARIYPEFVQNERVVKFTVVGSDDEAMTKYAKGERISQHMSHQLLNDENTEWEDNLDRMLHIWPVVGTVFQKTHYSPRERRPVTELCLPDHIIVNNNVVSLEKARRITHVMTMYVNDVLTNMRSGLYLEHDLDLIQASDGYEEDDDAPLCILEQQCYLDLDEDGYKEPYIVTLHKTSKKVLRIVSCIDKVIYTSDKKVQEIKRIEYYTDFHFIRSTNGDFYSVGLGTLLFPLNDAINTLLNQLVDAGTLSNQNSGLIGGDIRLKSGEFDLEMGEWKRVETMPGANLAQNIFPIPVREPSPTLFQLLQLLISVGKDLISANDPMQGKGLTQNVSPNTQAMMIEQGMKVFNAIHKRLYRSFRKLFRKIFNINAKYITQKEYRTVLDNPNADIKADYDISAVDILPIADPNMSSVPQRLAKAQALWSIPGIDPYPARIYSLQSLQIEPSMIEKLAPPPNPDAPPPPEAQKILAEVQEIFAKAQLLLEQANEVKARLQLDADGLQYTNQAMQAQAKEAEARIMKMQGDQQLSAAKVQLSAQKVQLSGAKTEHDAAMSELEMAHQREKDEGELTVKLMDTMKPEPKKENSE